MSPTLTSALSSRPTTAPDGRKYCASRSVPASLSDLPLASTSLTIGRRSLAALPRDLGSVITRLVRPVTSSVDSCTVTPSMKSEKRATPATSVTIGWVCGSQVAMTLPPDTESPSAALITEPYGTL